MPEYLFLDKSAPPTDKLLAGSIGDLYSLWSDIKKNVNELFGETKEEWKFYSKKTGWTLKILLKKRNLFFFKPYSGYFTLTFVFGDKAVKVIEDSDIPEKFKATLRDAKKYVDGRGLLIEVKNKNILPVIKKLIEIKINN